MQLLDDGQVVNNANLGRVLDVSRQAVWRYQRDHPELFPWINAELERAAASYVGLVKQRLAHLAMRGSVEHAKLFLESVGARKQVHEVKASLLDLLTGGG